MTVFRWTIAALWLVFVVYWAVSAVGVKRSVGATAWWRRGALRLSIVVLAVLAFSIPEVHRTLQAAQAHADGVITGAIGTALVGLGVGLAIFARIHLGRNWGTPMSRKENPELITGGPYAVIRHPIYTGIFLAMVGSTIEESTMWLLPLALFTGYFIYSARREEALMCEQFPEEYPAYKRRTKMFFPFML
jgi:protein-S-isoprenylcysteine O-methyltransferase Ste14